MSIQPRGILHLSPSEIAGFFLELRTIGTPAALQVIKDIEVGIKAFNRDIKRIQNL